MKFGIVILSKIGHDGYNYINDNNFPSYDFYIDLPNYKYYNGVAVMVKRSCVSVTKQDNLKIPKTCQWDKYAQKISG